MVSLLYLVCDWGAFLRADILRNHRGLIAFVNDFVDWESYIFILLLRVVPWCFNSSLEILIWAYVYISWRVINRILSKLLIYFKHCLLQSFSELSGLRSGILNWLWFLLRCHPHESICWERNWLLGFIIPLVSQANFFRVFFHFALAFHCLLNHRLLLDFRGFDLVFDGANSIFASLREFRSHLSCLKFF